MKILGTGLSGLVGSRIVELLSGEAYSFENISLSTGIDITDTTKISKLILNSDATWIFHFAAFTDVDKAELDRENGENGMCWNVNVQSTATIAHACKIAGKKMLYISTDYVFDGKKDSYNEFDQPNPQGWYGITKYAGEKHVAALGNSGVIIRIANPYRNVWNGKLDFVHKILVRLGSMQTVSAPTDQLFVPTYIDDIATAIKTLLDKNATGVYHVVGSETLAPFEAVRKIAEEFNCDQNLIQETTYADFYKNRAPRPFHASLENGKITKCGVQMKSFSEGLRLIH